jgi:hypothetical protein
MTLLFIDGFDAQDAVGKWTSTLFNAPTYGTTGRYGSGKAIQLNGGSGELRKDFTASGTVVIGFAYRASSLLLNDVICRLQFGNNTIFQLQQRGTGALRLLNASSASLLGDSAALVSGTWYWIEIKFKSDPTTGIAEVRVNGAVPSGHTPITSGNTNASAGNADRLVLNPSNVSNYQFDDLYILNGLGSLNNDFRGECVVQTKVPNGAGSSTQFTPTGAPNNWENVNELPVSATDYNSSSTVGHRDLYAMEDLAAGTGVVYGVQESIVAAKSGVTDAAIKTALKSGATTATGTSRALTTTPTLYTEAPRETDPNTSAAWSAAAVNAIEFGAEVA